MSLELVTGKRGEAHVKSEDIGAFNAGIVSAGQYVLSTGSKFNYEIVTNNSIWIYDGEAIDQGRHMRIKPNDYEIVTIENGTQSQKRNDLIVLRYSKDTETGIESAEIKVIKGTSGSVPTDPPYITGNILTGDTTDDFPLYRVYLDGLNIESVEPLFHVLCSMEELKNNVSELNSALSKTAEDLKQANTRLNNKADQSSLNFTNTKLNVIGTVYRNIKEITVGSGGVDSYSGGASIAIPAGTYIVTAKGNFTSNASESTRRVQVYNNTKNAGISTSSCYGKNYLSFKEVCILDLTEQNILSCRLSTGIGANLAGCGTEIAAIRIK